jgi:ABC-type Fe3+-hydroxamate transport system substrate-binding protein
MTHRLPAVLAAITLTAAACAGSDSDTSDASTAKDSSDTSSATTPEAVEAVTADANNASADELIAALEANGVTNAEKWAEEIEEYRPYPTDDPTFGRLRDELEKYNPDPITLEAIVASLSL